MLKLVKETKQIKNLPLVADLITGVYVRPEGDGYIAGYDGNGEWHSDNLEPNYNSWNEIWEHLFFRFPKVFDKIDFFSRTHKEKCFKFYIAQSN